jgi:dnd system-associated protein 4
MAEAGRIRVAKDKAELVKSLTSIDGERGPFQTYADVIAFAAALGAKHDKRVPFVEVSQKEPSPVRLESFISIGYDSWIKLLAIDVNKNLKTLSVEREESGLERHLIFEEYANGGLEILQSELRGSVDFTERILLILNSERFGHSAEKEEFDLGKFL